MKTFLSRFSRQPGFAHCVQMSSKRRISAALVLVSMCVWTSGSTTGGRVGGNPGNSATWLPTSGTIGGGGGIGGGTSNGTDRSCSARFKASWILLMASFRVLRWLRNYCDPFLLTDDSNCAKGLPQSWMGLRCFGLRAGPWDLVRQAQTRERLHGQLSAGPVSPDRRKNR